MPIPLIVAGAGLMTLGGLAAVTQEASKIGFPSSSGSGDDEWGETSYGDRIREYESIAIGGIDDEDSDDKRRGSQGAAAGAVAGSSAGVAAIEASKGCKKCTAIGLVGPHKQFVDSWSIISINYQQRICSTTLGLKGTRTYINEYKCLDVAFDGWKEEECLFLEAKGKYDQFFKGDGEPWYDGVEDTFNQGTRHQFVMESLENVPYCHWHFLQPKSASYFKQKFAKYTNLKVFHTP
ncbi:Tox-REase-5 domain-containing protein [Moellerella wisconsensis]|uniref:Tox-REase-5 domain-containing protein n=2 Tax=Moellerella wisconsensis TaxID=158849 RepID=UPI002410DBB6|nr:Tox-REase-5 domain-containing protein [Moellerella wisconsensis]